MFVKLRAPSELHKPAAQQFWFPHIFTITEITKSLFIVGF